MAFVLSETGVNFSPGAECGYYFMRGLNEDSCQVTSSIYPYFMLPDGTCDPKAGLKEDLLSETKIVPNPTEGFVNIILDKNLGSKISFVLYNSIGEKVKCDEIINYNYKIDLSEYERGLYYLKLSDGEHFTTKKIIKI